MFTHGPRPLWAALLCLSGLSTGWLLTSASGEDYLSPPILHKVQAANDRLEMTVNSSRLITLDLNIPRAQVNNKDIVDLTPLSPNVIQIFAKKAGITQVNLWDEKQQIHSIDVVVFGDARELSQLLQSQFPHASVNVRPSANSVILSGFVPEPDQAAQIQRIAEDYYPKVVNLLKVGGVQQILLHVKVMEVSRTKLRAMGFDWAQSSGGSFVVSSVSGLIDAAANGQSATGLGDTVRFGIVDGNSNFFGFLEALRRYDLAKVMAEPTLVTTSGRPAFFNDGGEFPILIPAGLGTVSVDFKKFGTQVDFVPIVLGNGNIRLEVKPRVSELDPTTSVTVSGITVPGLKVREVDTGVEMKAGQTLAIAGLVQNRVEYTNLGVPYLADLPYFGAPFRKTQEQINEIELLVMVTPELVEAMDPCEAPPCGPGLSSQSPSDCQLYWKGNSEIPSCGPCAPGGNCGYQGEAYQGQQGEPVPAPMPSRDASPPPGAGIKSGSSFNAPANHVAPYTGLRSPDDTGSLPLDPNQPILYSRQTSYDRSNPSNPQANRPAARPSREPNLIGPVGYDVVN